MRLDLINKEELAIKCGSVKCVPKVHDNGFEVIISYRFKDWFLNIQWLKTNPMSLTKNEVERIKVFAQYRYNMYHVKKCGE